MNERQKQRGHGGKLAAVRRTDFTYDLPEELIAQQPLAERSASRLLTLDGATGALADRQMRDLPQLMAPGDLLVFNDTRVIPARLFALKDSGGKVELLLERPLDSVNGAGACARQQAAASGHVAAEPRRRHPHRREARRPVGDRTTGARARVLRALRPDAVAAVHPPRARRGRQHALPERVRAQARARSRRPPRACISTRTCSPQLDARGVHRAFVTLHVGAGTFQPVRTDAVGAHVMHAEFVEVSAAACDAVAAARARGGRIIAVGTTVVRALESAAGGGALAPYVGDSSLFIVPGFRFRVVDAMVTNFHLPESTLLMLVSAFAGREAVLAAYRHAVAGQYRFFSYGDAMFVTPAPGAHA